jgi:hypothetical protein
MKRDELPQYSGKRVTLHLNGDENRNARLYADDPGKAYVSIAEPAEWALAARYYLTDADVESLSDDGSNGLIGAIYLKREGDSLISDSSPQSEK